MFFNGIAYFFEQIYSQLNTTEADYCPYGLFSQPLNFQHYFSGESGSFAIAA